jgi:DNA polymerase epsilon subunit 2
MLLHQRTQRNQLFAPPVVGSSETQRYRLQTIEYLLGTASKVDNVLVLGMVTQIKEGTYYLEDVTGHVKIDIAETISFPSYYTSLANV